MPNQEARQMMIDNLQDSLRLIRHLMELSVEEFADAIGVTRQTVNNLENKKTKMSAIQYIAIAALIDNCLVHDRRRLAALKAILDSDGKDYGAEYDTAFRDDSLLKRWFEDVTDRRESYINPDDKLTTLARDYKIFLDAAILTTDDAKIFVDELTAAFKTVDTKFIVPLRSIEEVQTYMPETKYRQALRFISTLRAAGVLKINGEDSDPDFHDTMLKVFKNFYGTYNLCLITADEQLAGEVLQMNFDDGDKKICAGYVDAGKFKFYDADELNKPDIEPNTFTDGDNKFDGWEEL